MNQLKKTLLTLVALLAVTTGAWAQYPIVYDFEAAANAEENPANKNGSAANGQAFYGWENAEKTDNKRQDYKGYEWAEGSVLPEVCHVWRRSDRINGNVSGNGGLKCPSNKEMAIDGLTPGLAVTFIYDATAAADDSKELVWAIGDGTADGGPGSPRATATINGVEAVPGATTIKSGDVIIVNSVTEAENGSGYIVVQVKKGMVIKKIIIDVAPAATAVTFTRGTGDKANEWMLDGGMPAGNVEVNVDYYPKAQFAMSNDERPWALVPAPSDAIISATTDEPLVGPGTVADIPGSTDGKKQGTVMFYVGTTDNLTEAQLIALIDEGKWSADVPTAADISEAGTVYVYYYIKGNDGDTDETTFSDGDFCDFPIEVEIKDAPPHNVEFAEGTPEPDKWSASPNTDVTKGETVTVTYSGSRKVIGVKAEKKAEPKKLTVGNVTFYYDEGQTFTEAKQKYADLNSGWILNGPYISVQGAISIVLFKGESPVEGTSKIEPNAEYSWIDFS